MRHDRNIATSGTTDYCDPASPAVPKVAIVHYWLVGSGGGENVVKAMLELFPQADVFT